MSITENKERLGSFTSSEIYKLIPMGSAPMNEEELKKFKIDNPGSKKKNKACGFGAAGLTYIQEKQIEKRMGRSIKTEVHTRSMAWGKFMEMFVFAKIGTAYEITSTSTDVHPTIKGWSGSKDLIIQGKMISEIKCYEPKHFALYTDALLSKDVNRIKKEFSEEYWQLVSNAVINQVPGAEAITFMPYEKDLEEIREMAENYEGSDQWKYRFIAESHKSALPYLPNKGYYKDLNKFSFVVPQEDIDLLTSRVEEAIKLLNDV